MLSHAPGVAYTTFLCLFCSLGFLPIAAIRAQMGPPALGVNLGYGFTSALLSTLNSRYSVSRPVSSRAKQMGPPALGVNPGNGFTGAQG